MKRRGSSEIMEIQESSGGIFKTTNSRSSSPLLATESPKLRFPTSSINDLSRDKIACDNLMKKDSKLIRITTERPESMTPEEVKSDERSVQEAPSVSQYIPKAITLQEKADVNEPSALQKDQSKGLSLKISQRKDNMVNPVIVPKIGSGLLQTSGRCNVGVKFIAPGRGRLFQTRRKERQKVTNFAIRGTLDIHSTLSSYKFGKKPPHDLVIKNDFDQKTTF